MIFTVLSITALIFSVIALGLTIYLLRQPKIEMPKVDTSNLKRAIQSLQKQHKLLNNSSMGVGQRLIAVERQLRQVSSRQDDIEQSKSTDLNFQHAVKLVNMGASVQELMNSCGLSRGEAELLLTVHQKQGVE